MSNNSFKQESLSEFYESPEDKPTSFATNNTRSLSMFKERTKYRNDVFPDGTIKNMVDTWGKDSFYGIINTRGNSIIPDDSFLKPLRYSSEENSLYALGFVADAFRDFAEKMRDLAENNIIYKESPWATPTAKKAMIFAGNEYDSYMLDNMYPVFRELYLPHKNRSSKIENMNSFLEQFTNFQTGILRTAGPMTLSGFMESSYSSVRMSGLVIEIGDDKYDVDEDKGNVYGDVNFQLAARIAEQYGFSIDRNIPWRLVANMGNPALQEYMFGVPLENVPFDNQNLEKCQAILRDDQYPELFGYSQIPEYSGIKRHTNTYIKDNMIVSGYQILDDVEIEQQEVNETFMHVYDRMYIETWKIDIEFLKTYILGFYNAFVRSAPRGTSYNPVQNCSNKIRVWDRTEEPEVIFDGLYGDLWFLKTFYTVRSLERQAKKSVQVQSSEIRRIINIYDNSSARPYQASLEYAQENFIGPCMIDPLTYTTVADILINRRTESNTNDVSDPGRQIRVRGNIY